MQLLDQFLLAQTQWLLGIPAFAAGLPKGPNGALVPDRPKRLPLLKASPARTRNDAVAPIADVACEGLSLWRCGAGPSAYQLTKR